MGGDRESFQSMHLPTYSILHLRPPVPALTELWRHTGRHTVNIRHPPSVLVEWVKKLPLCPGTLFLKTETPALSKFGGKYELVTVRGREDICKASDRLFQQSLILWVQFWINKYSDGPFWPSVLEVSDVIVPCFPPFSFFLFFFFLKILFICREKGRKKERERNINAWLPLVSPLPGTWPANQACALTENRISDFLLCSLALNPLSHTSQGSSLFLMFQNPLYSWN